MTVRKTKKYFGEKPLDGPVPFGAMYREDKHDNKVNPNQDKQDQVFSHRNFAYPSTTELAEYDRICKGSSVQIIAMLDKEQAHRQKMSVKSLEARVLSERMAIFLSFFAIVIMVIATIFMSIQDAKIPAIITACCAVIAVIAVYKYKTRPVEQRHHNHKNRFRHDNNRKR